MNINDIEVLCITLDPSSKERAQRTKNHVLNLGFDPSKFNFLIGIDGRKMSDEDIKNYVTPRAYMELKHGRYVHEALSTKGSVGCYLSHLKALEECVKSGNVTAIFEDDFLSHPVGKRNLQIVLKEAMDNNFDILRLTSNNYMYNKQIPSDKLKYLDRVDSIQGLAGYIVTPKAASIILQDALKMDVHIDHFLNMVSEYKNLNHYIIKSEYPIEIYNFTESLIKHNSLKDNHEFKYCNWFFISIFLIIIIIILLIYMYKNEIGDAILLL